MLARPEGRFLSRYVRDAYYLRAPLITRVVRDS